jgi:hypothetical protein
METMRSKPKEFTTVTKSSPQNVVVTTLTNLSSSPIALRWSDVSCCTNDHLLLVAVAAGLRDAKPSGDAVVATFVAFAQQKGGYDHA